VRAILVQVLEGIDLLLVEDRKGMFEVVVGDVGDETAVLVVEVDDLQGGVEVEQQDRPGPDAVQRVQQGVLPPLFLNLGVDFGELPVLEGLRQVLEEGEPLLDLRPQLRKFGLEVVPHLAPQVEHVRHVDAAEGVLDVVH
jgi:hypothetical protein